jgi:hypothetical protein
MRPLLPLLVLLLPRRLAPPRAPHARPAAQAHRYVDISAAKIEKTRTFEYGLSLFESPVRVVINSSHLSFEGNFSRFVLFNSALKKEFIYWGRQLVVKLPAEHVFNMKKIPNLEIQIVHKCEEVTRDNPYHYLLLSQLYVVSKFTNKIETNLSKYLHAAIRDGDTINTADIVKMLDGFSVTNTLPSSSCIEARRKPTPAGKICSACSNGSTSSSVRRTTRRSSNSCRADRERLSGSK